MGTCRLDRDGEVFVLTLCDGENRFDPHTVGAIDAALDEVEASSGPAALVTTGEGKYFSNGLALEWMLRGEAEGEPERAAENLEAVYRLLARLLTFPVPTVAAVNGHWFGAGALLGLVHDRRVVRSDRGWFCMPEAAMGVGIAWPLLEVLRATLPLASFRDLCVTSARVPGAEVAERGFADAVARGDDVLARAVEWARRDATDKRAALVDIKTLMYASTVAMLRGETPSSRSHRPVGGADLPR
jgi:enoyl-CoA hydratase/carnithine racemase